MNVLWDTIGDVMSITRPSMELSTGVCVGDCGGRRIGRRQKTEQTGHEESILPLRLGTLWEGGCRSQLFRTAGDEDR